MVRYFGLLQDFETPHGARVGNEDVARVADGFGVAGSSCVSGADEVDQAFGLQDVVGFTVWEHIEVAAVHGDVAWLAESANQFDQTLGLSPSFFRIALAVAVPEAVELNDGHGLVCVAVDDAGALGDAGSQGGWPLVVVDEAAVNKLGGLSDDGVLRADKGREAEVLEMRLTVDEDRRPVSTAPYRPQGLDNPKQIRGRECGRRALRRGPEVNRVLSFPGQITVTSRPVSSNRPFQRRPDGAMRGPGRNQAARWLCQSWGGSEVRLPAARRVRLTTMRAGGWVWLTLRRPSRV